jgi:hypothetical protein
MNFAEFQENVTAGTIKNGDKFWLTGYYYDDITKKPARQVRPTRVAYIHFTPQIRGNAYVGRNNEYRWRHTMDFVVLNAKDEQLAKTLTMTSSLQGQEDMQVCFTQEEAKQWYVQHCKRALEQIEEEQIRQATFFNELADSLNREVFKYS